jgi:hypothetical protein
MVIPLLELTERLASSGRVTEKKGRAVAGLDGSLLRVFFSTGCLSVRLGNLLIGPCSHPFLCTPGLWQKSADSSISFLRKAI